MVRTASSLTGPWSKEKILFKIQEIPSGSFCYAAKEHPEFNGAERKMLVTYVCNSMDFVKLVQNMEIYLPRTVWLGMK